MGKKTLLNPDKFIITRKRKLYRFALFSNAENCFELKDWKPLKTSNGEIVVEVGAGTALFTIELASRYPDKQFVALDVKADRLQRGARLALERGLTNTYFVRARADQLLEVVKPHSVSDIWLTFSDPFSRQRDAKRRLTYRRFLEIYKNAHVAKHAHLYMKTDNEALFDWSVEELKANKWHIDEMTRDLHASSLSDDYKIMTTYETKFMSEGLPTYFLSASEIHE